MKKILIGIITIFLCTILVGCGKANSKDLIVGKWKNSTTIKGYEFIYTFNKDGTGKYDAAGTIMNFTYKIEGDNISIKYEGENMEPFDTKFSIDGNTLNIVDSFGNDTLYKKEK